MRELEKIVSRWLAEEIVEELTQIPDMIEEYKAIAKQRGLDSGNQYAYALGAVEARVESIKKRLENCLTED